MFSRLSRLCSSSFPRPLSAPHRLVVAHLSQTAQRTVLVPPVLSLDSNPQPSRPSSSLKLSVPLPQKGSVLFHIPLSQTVEEFLYDVKTEDRSVKTVQLLQGEHEEDSRPVAMAKTWAGFLRNLKQNEKVFLALEQKVMELDVQEIQVRKQQAREKLDFLETELATLLAKKNLLDRKFDNRHLMYRLAFAGVLTVELGVIVHLTYDLGWDLMEPVTYLLGLGTGILAYIIHGVTHNEFGYETHMDRYLEKRRQRLYSRNGFDSGAYEKMVETARRLRAEDGHLVKVG